MSATEPSIALHKLEKLRLTSVGEHPILSAVPVGEDTNSPYFVRLPEIDLAKSIFFDTWNCDFAQELDGEDDGTSSESWGRKFDEFIESQHDTPFTPGLPFWRLHIIPGSRDEQRFIAVFVYHHALGDGSSGKAFHTTFLRALPDALAFNPGEVEKIVKTPNKPLLPTLEALRSLQLSFFYILKVIFNTKLWPRRDPELWTGEKIHLPLKNKMHHITVPEKKTAVLKRLCRKHGATITAALQTLVARALFAHLPNQFKKLHCSGAVSTRRWLPRDIVTDDSIGVWVLDFSEDYTREAVAGQPSFPWDEAQRSRKTIETFLHSQGRNTNVALLKFVRDYHRDLLTSMIGKDRGASFEVSNIGMLTDPTSFSGLHSNENDKHPGGASQPLQKPRIGRMIFSQSGNVAGCAVNVSVITGGDGCLVLTFCWQESAVETGLVKAVIEQVQKDIDMLTEDAH
ncbi:predicted protein [Uncinocarpus reesii 1704]|uniref:Diacylglycerol O-acyltransferase n=1 Tax=Uncinocarpus reesii (strain UAMH 1704) TaxID=336963 RepID=C4JG49_UNCRE|nr:uncharacterized protein UREG_02447 [Uncinocarpus reesii 1704]EEP77598.1 predicted protein [Uncinocarpus reesii 1704]